MPVAGEVRAACCHQGSGPQGRELGEQCQSGGNRHAQAKVEKIMVCRGRAPRVRHLASISSWVF